MPTLKLKGFAVYNGDDFFVYPINTYKKIIAVARLPRLAGDNMPNIANTVNRIKRSPHNIMFIFFLTGNVSHNSCYVFSLIHIYCFYIIDLISFVSV